jgi:site-specific DNA-methyltransferase (adenine-specific)
MTNTRIPDILECLSNLSNDEVFTTPALANQILDTLPSELWSNKNATFLDPFTKSGVFLREITKRLLKGLETQIPDLQERINHILKNQVFGIATTELTSLVARRSVYCSKKANSEKSIATIFDNEQGNILFEKLNHEWKNGKCQFCGANQLQYERNENLEQHAYPFLHTQNPLNFFNEMKFDVIVGNPPYQMSDGGDKDDETRTRGGATPLYDKFVTQAKKMNPNYLLMIIPSRWFAGGRGLDEFREEMLNDKRITKIIDFPRSSDCFPGVEIKGGVCYFLWDSNNTSDECEITTIRGSEVSTMNRKLLEKNCNTFLRYNESIDIYNKVKNKKEETFDKIVSSMKPFGFRTFYKGKKENKENNIKLYANKSIGFVTESDIVINKEWIKEYKVFVTRSYGAGEDFPHQILNKPILGEPNTCCTETYIVLGIYSSKKRAENAISYIKTRFFRFMVLLIKNTQDAPKKVYQFVPMQNFDEEWTDEKLYKKYGLEPDEIAFIESMVRPMV